MSLIMSVAPDSCTFEWIVLSMDDFHRRGLISFRHRRQPFSWLHLVLLVLIIIDLAVDLTMTFILEYDERRMMQFGNMGLYFAGSAYRFFGAVVTSYKGMATAFLLNHLLTDYGFIRQIDHKLALVAPRVGVCRHQMTRVVRLSRRIIASFHSMVWGVSMPIVIYHFLVTYRSYPLLTVLPCIVENCIVASVHTFLVTVFIGEYYLMVQYCIALVDKAKDNFQDMIQRDKTAAELNQCLSDFEVVCEVLKHINNYLGRIYLIFVLVMSIFLPVIFFNVVYVNVNIVFKYFLSITAAYYCVLMCFMAQIAGEVNYKIEKSANLLYRELLLKNIWQKLFSIKHKIVKFQLQTLHGIGLRVMGQLINLSTCITITTVYITVFSLFLGSRNSVQKNNFLPE